MEKKKDKMQKKVASVMREYSKGQLHSGKGGPVVKSREQAVAIAMSEGRKKVGMKLKTYGKNQDLKSLASQSN